MKAFELTILLALSANFLVAAPSLIGVWKSNKELSVESMYMDQSIKEESKEKFKNLFGHLQITYTKSKAKAYMPADHGFEEWESTSTYRIQAATNNKIIIKWKDTETGEEDTQTLTFVNPDRYWIELFTSEKFRGREYFDRVKAEPVGTGQPM